MGVWEKGDVLFARAGTRVRGASDCVGRTAGMREKIRRAVDIVGEVVVEGMRRWGGGGEGGGGECGVEVFDGGGCLAGLVDLMSLKLRRSPQITNAPSLAAVQQKRQNLTGRKEGEGEPESLLSR